MAARVFHAALTDGEHRSRDTAVPVHRKLVASFVGEAYVAEREEGGNLNIYLTSSEIIPSSVIGDRGPMTAARLQAINEASRRRVIRGSR